MNNTALIYDGFTLNWFGIILAAASLSGAAVACILRKLQKGFIYEILTMFCIGVPLALLMARLQYYFLSGLSMDKGFGYAFSGIRDGGFGHYGAILGVGVAVLITAHLLKASVGELADCAAVAGAGILAVGRFAMRFSDGELGFSIKQNAFTVNNTSDGLGTLAVYKLDGIVASVIFLACVGFFFYSYLTENGISDFSKGNVALIFLMLHGLNQVVMDSLCKTTLYLFGNSFVKCSQILGITSWLVAICYIIIRTVRKKKFDKKYLIIIAAFILLVAECVAMEYRMGDANYISGRVVMGICAAALGILSVALLCLGEKGMPDKKVKADTVSVKSAKIAPIMTHETIPNDMNFESSFFGGSLDNRVGNRKMSGLSNGIHDELEDDFDDAFDDALDDDFDDDFDNDRHYVPAAPQTKPVRRRTAGEREFYSSYNNYSSADDDLDYPFPDTCVKPKKSNNHRISQNDLDDMRRMFDDMDRF